MKNKIISDEEIHRDIGHGINKILTVGIHIVALDHKISKQIPAINGLEHHRDRIKGLEFRGCMLAHNNTEYPGESLPTTICLVASTVIANQMGECRCVFTGDFRIGNNPMKGEVVVDIECVGITFGVTGKTAIKVLI